MLISITSGFGQGIIKGTIADAEDNVPLVAATVSLKGTTIGTVTDFNGEYILTVKPGNHTLVISYLGYDTKEMPVTVEDDQTLVMNESLSLATFTGEVVIVTAQARGQLAAMNQQIKSNQIINVVSAERIRELPDENAAQAISRLPGIHLDGSKVVVRGIDSKMNKITVNGIELPSTEENSRSTDLGIVSANMLSGIEVYKSLTPDMDADAVGGVVNLRLREAAKGFHYSLTAQGGYNRQEDILSKKLVWGDVSDRFFNDRFGVLINVNYEEKNGGDDRVDMGYITVADKNPTGIVDNDFYRLNSVNVYDQLRHIRNIGGTMVIDFDIKNGQLIYSGMLSHSLNNETVHRDEMTMDVKYRRFYINRRENESMLLNNSLRYEQQIGIVKLDASIANTSVENNDNFRYNVRFNEDQANPAFADFMTSAYRDGMQPTDIYNVTVDSTVKEFRLYTCDYNPVVYDENQWLGELNMQIPLRISDNINIDFKLGGKYIRKDRNYDLDDYIIGDNAVTKRVSFLSINDWMQTVIPTFDANRSVLIFFPLFQDAGYETNEKFIPGYRMDYVISQDICDEMMIRQLSHDPVTMEVNSEQYRHDYWGFETKMAGYAMTTINLGKRLVLIPGIRYEKTHNEYTAYLTYQGSTGDYGLEDTITRPADHENWLPHLHARFQAFRWWDIRFSYNKTLSRPDYNYTIPAMHYDKGQSTPEAGNPMLRPAVSDNYDANFTFHADKIGLITIGGYIKEIKDIFYLQQSFLENIPDSFLKQKFPVVAYPSMLRQEFDYYINSPYTAHLKGLELEWQSNFSWLAPPFNGIVLNANYTHVWSETKYVQHATRDSIVQIGFLRIPVKVEHDTFFVNRLINQANDIGNVSVGYDYKGFSARMSFRYQGNVIRRIATNPQANEYTHNIYSFDFVVKQRIPFKLFDLEVFFNAINITGAPAEKRYHEYNYLRNYYYPNAKYNGKTDTYLRYSGAQFNFGIRIKS